MNGWKRGAWPSLVALLPLAGCGAHEKKVEADAAPRSIHVTVAAPEQRAVERAIDVVGTLKGWEEVTVGAKKAGRVVRVRHDVGDRVAPGDPLVELETQDADLAIDQREKQLLAELAKVGVILETIPKQVPSVVGFDVARLPSVVQAQVALDRARQNLAREKNLMEKRAGTMQEMQNAENDVKNAEAGLSNAVLTARSVLANALAAKIGLDVARQARVDMEIHAPTPSQPPFGLKAPVAYAVSKRSVSEGQMIREGDAVMEMVVENPLRLWVNVPERYAGAVKHGQDVRIAVPSEPGKTFPGKVARISPAIEAASRTFQVEAAVPNDGGKLRPGGFAKAEVVIDNHARATIVPLDAIVRYAGVTKLFLVDAKGAARSLAVETGEEGQGWVEVLTPLPADARVVTTGQGQLADGSPVVIRTPGPAASEAGPAPAEATATPPATGG